MSPNPENPDQLDINNRHRLLRRGRPYREANDARIAGTHFMCLNADIERQFEFVQRTWLNAPNFQGLTRQPDPLVGHHRAGDRFIIPHASNLTDLRYGHPTPLSNLQQSKGGQGAKATACDPQIDNASKAPACGEMVAQFTRLRGGGYFFLPSRAALAYLAHPSRPFSANKVK